MNFTPPDDETHPDSRSSGDSSTAPGTGISRPSNRKSKRIRKIFRAVIMVGALVALVAGVLTGLTRLDPWFWQFPRLTWFPSVQHGPLMIGGFLGTLIGLERAVGLGSRWAFGAPLLCAAGAVHLILYPGSPAGVVLVSAGSVVFGGIAGRLYSLQPGPHTLLLGVSALSWVVGNGLWLSGQPLYLSVPWWTLFLVWIIAGERLELNRLLRLSRTSSVWLGTACAVSLAGAGLTPAWTGWGVRVMGLGWLGLGTWLLRYDIARQILHLGGKRRFSAVCLFTGYLWLTGSGGLWIVHADQFTAGPAYGNMLHGIFLGFVFSMIFGHAPIIAGAVQGITIPYHPVFYLHLILLHASLVLRVGSNEMLWVKGRFWGGVGNGVAILAFLAVTVLAIVLRPRS